MDNRKFCSQVRPRKSSALMQILPCGAREIMEFSFLPMTTLNQIDGGAGTRTEHALGGDQAAQVDDDWRHSRNVKDEYQERA